MQISSGKKQPGLLLQNLKPTSDENAAQFVDGAVHGSPGRWRTDAPDTVERLLDVLRQFQVKVLPEMKKTSSARESLCGHLDESLLPQPDLPPEVDDAMNSQPCSAACCLNSGPYFRVRRR